MKWLCKGAGALTFFIVAVYVAAGHTTIFMPGPVSTAHQKVPGPNCPACHRPWDLTHGGTAGCVSETCHVPLRYEGGHRGHVQTSCPQCHVEHGTTRLASARPPSDAPCLGCHAGPAPPTQESEAQRGRGAEEQGGNDKESSGGEAPPRLKKDHPTGLACQQCHFYHVAPRNYLPAVLRTTAIPMKHSVHLGAMAEIFKVKDRYALCATCHQARENTYRFAPFTRQGCFRDSDDCHQPKRIEGQKKFKDPLVQKPVVDYAKPQRMPNALFVHSNHVKKVQCAECHAGIEKARRITHAPIATEALCARCHNAKKTWLTFKEAPQKQ